MADRVTLTKHVGNTIERIRKNANKSKGPFRARYKIGGTIKADADFDAEGDVVLTVPVLSSVGGDASLGVDISREGQGDHVYELEVETVNDDWVEMKKASA